MEVLLKAWFKDDADALTDIDHDRFIIQDGEDILLPQLWEKVLRQDANVTFRQNLPFKKTQAQSPPQEPDMTSPPNGPNPSVEAEPEGLGDPEGEEGSLSTDDSDELDAAIDPEVENRIQYTVNYFRRSDYRSMEDEFEMKAVYNEPVELELDSEHARLPALEEIQRVTAPRYSSPRRKGDGKNRKKTRLRPGDLIGETQLRINSPFLLNALRSFVTYSAESPEGDDEGLASGVFKYPYRDLCLHIDQLQQYKTDSTGLRNQHSEQFNQKCDAHIDLLQDYLDSQRGLSIKESQAMWERTRPATSFASIWLLLKPGSDVYVREPDGSLNAYIVDKVEGGVSETDSQKTSVGYVVLVWNLVLGDKDIRSYMRKININVFDHEREITNLPVFPVRFIDDRDNDKTKQALIERGKNYFKYSKGPKFLQYTGVGLKSGRKVRLLTNFHRDSLIPNPSTNALAS